MKLLLIIAVLAVASTVQAAPLADQTPRQTVIIDRLPPAPPRFQIHTWSQLIAYLRWLAN